LLKSELKLMVEFYLETAICRSTVEMKKPKLG
jgi:hypothetical protein